MTNSMSTIWNFLTSFMPAKLAFAVLVLIAVLLVVLIFKIVKMVLDALPFL